MKPLGRPPINNPKDKRLQIRVDEKTIELLDRCAEAKGTNRSEIVREGIELVSESLETKTDE
jgi:uncharacterized protein (DUF1778 family)